MPTADGTPLCLFCAGFTFCLCWSSSWPAGRPTVLDVASERVLLAAAEESFTFHSTGRKEVTPGACLSAHHARAAHVSPDRRSYAAE